MAERWYKLDNAAKIFPALSYNNPSNYFRLAAVLENDINPDILKEAVKISLKRFPTFKVKLKHGLFWYYFDNNDGTPLVRCESPLFFDTINTDQHQRFLFCVEYTKKRISLQMYHALSDGTGGLEFFKTIIYYYLRLSGIDIVNDGSIINEEYEKLSIESQDSFHKNYNKHAKKLDKEQNAYQISGTKYQDNWVGIVHVMLNINDLKTITKSLNVTVNEYLSAVMLYVLYKKYQDDKKKPIVLFTPVNARKYFNSKSLRNFVLFIRTTLDATKEYTFQDILEYTKSCLQERLKKEYLESRLAFNVKIEKNFFVRILPLFLKNIAMKLSYKIEGNNKTTCSFSNLGVIKVPNDFYKHVKSMYFVIGTSSTSVTASTYNETLTISFSTRIIERTFQRDFVRFLSDQGLNITIQTNDLEVEE